MQGDFLNNGVTDHAGVYACVVMQMVMTLLTIVLYLSRLALLLEGYIQRPDCLL